MQFLRKITRKTTCIPKKLLLAFAPNPKTPNSMNAFLSTIFIQNTVAEYEIFQLANKFKAILVSNNSLNQLPVQLTFWKEGGKWKTYNAVSEHVLYQFGNQIDNELLTAMVDELKIKAA